MLILADVRPAWTDECSFKKAAKRVGIAPASLNVDNIQQDKFIQAERIQDVPTSPQKSAFTIILNSICIFSHPLTTIYIESYNNKACQI